MAAAPQARKVVTILFADIAGSTELGDRLDPEALREVLGRYFAEMRAIVERHGGTVEKFIGDALMAVFGVPLVREDDAIRAVRAAVDMRAALASLNEELERSWGVSLAIRTGINTGEVVAGDVGQGELIATGSPVNLAARFQQSAQPGEILIGENTYRLIRNAATVEQLAPLALKGKGEAVAAYRLLAFARAVGRGPPFRSALVGREHEHRLLHNAFERTKRDRSCHLFTLLGPAGIGKSRLAEEFLRETGEEATIVRGHCPSYGEGITYWPVVEVVNQVTGLRHDDPPDLVRARLGSLLAAERNASVIVERIAQVMGASDVTAARDECLWAVRKLFEALARERPLVALFEDIHWAEPTFLDVLEHVADWVRDRPILLLCLARRELLDTRPSWAGGKPNATSVGLEPLSSEESERLIDNLLTGVVAPEARARVTEAAAGNPLFVEEMVTAMVEEGLLEQRDGSWIARIEGAGFRPPPSVHALLAARLDRLEPEERTALELASIEGQIFHRGAVAALAPESMRATVELRLMALLRKDLLWPNRAAFAGEEAFRFRHVLTCGIAYESLPKRARADLHEGYASWLEQKGRTGTHRYREILGYHFEQAYRYRAELGPVDERGRELAAVAATHLGGAGRRALARGDLPAAVNLLARAASLLPADADLRSDLLSELGGALLRAGGADRAAEVVAEREARAASQSATST